MIAVHQIKNTWLRRLAVLVAFPLCAIVLCLIDLMQSVVEDFWPLAKDDITENIANAKHLWKRKTS